ncbi:MAG: 2OG-Fe(II) oxygenase [Candidatus Eremiobacteraeota bacterium]|nr:2OG-Fe(II) oxygenase [Candidatus Eremiobacteraeota bacterium]MBV9409054.1 2OG-Fe(II) oxygenase [Candidatus Eremiobacteraeota bacterium]
MSTASALDEKSEQIHIVRLLEPSDCAELIAKAEQVPNWHEALSYKEGEQELVVDESVRKNRVLQERDAARLFAPYRDAFERKFAKFLARDRENFFLLSLLVINCYEPGGHFHAHVDALATHHRYRRYSVVCYLNDDFVDGGTAFPTLQQTYRPATGQALLFPSYYLHEARPVTAGRKYVFVFFLCDATWITEDAYLAEGS